MKISSFLQEVWTLQKFTNACLALHLDFCTLGSISFTINWAKCMVVKKGNTDAYAKVEYEGFHILLLNC